MFSGELPCALVDGTLDTLDLCGLLVHCLLHSSIGFEHTGLAEEGHFGLRVILLKECFEVLDLLDCLLGRTKVNLLLFSPLIHSRQVYCLLYHLLVEGHLLRQLVLLEPGC